MRAGAWLGGCLGDRAVWRLAARRLRRRAGLGEGRSPGWSPNVGKLLAQPQRRDRTRSVAMGWWDRFCHGCIPDSIRIVNGVD